MKAHCLRLLALSSLSVVGACESSPNGPAVEVAIAPLELPGVAEICYQLAVYNGDGETVWSNDDVCSIAYGNAGGGGITYIAPCDADDGVSDNTVELVLDSVEVSGGAILDDQITTVDGDADFINPCTAASPCELTFECLENQDVLVEFNLTIIRDAEQGFFDVVVNFDDIFCSAKEDTCYAPDDPIELLFGDDQNDGPGRDHTAVIAVACSAGPDTADEDIETELLFTQIVLKCEDGAGAVEFQIDPTQVDAGNQRGRDTRDRYSLDWALYTGHEDLSCGSGSVHVRDGDGLYLYGPGGEYYAKFDNGLWYLYSRANGQEAAERVPGTASSPPSTFGKVDAPIFPFTREEPLSCNKKYTNIAINLDNLIGQGLKKCTLTYGATAKEADDDETFSYGQAVGKPGTTYPVFGGRDLPLFADGKVDCHHNPLDGVGFGGQPSGVQAGYMGQITGFLPQFCYSYIDDQLEPTNFEARHATRETALFVGTITRDSTSRVRLAGLGEAYAKLCGYKTIRKSSFVEMALGQELETVKLAASDYNGKYQDRVLAFAYLKMEDQYVEAQGFDGKFVQARKETSARIDEGASALVFGFVVDITEETQDANESFRLDALGVGRSSP